MKIKLLPYESCLKIGEEYFNKKEGPTYGLDRHYFDNIFEVKALDGNIYEAVSVDSRVAYTDIVWYIPSIFVSYVIH